MCKADYIANILCIVVAGFIATFLTGSAEDGAFVLAVLLIVFFICAEPLRTKQKNKIKNL